MGTERRIIYTSLLAKQAISNQFTLSTSPTAQSRGTPTFVLLGGELLNKGAQAMTFTVVDRLNREFPDCEIYLFSIKDYNAGHVEKYTFNILPWDIDIQLDLLGYRGQKFKKKCWDENTLNQVRNVFNDTTAIFDISGYNLSSQLGVDSVVRYVADIAIASKYEIPYYILPQSIGPFEFDAVGKITVGTILHTFLPYPKLICPREKEGVKAVNKYTTENVQLERDLVLQCPDYDISNISKDLSTDAPELQKEAVGLIPNKNVLQYADCDMVQLYQNLIKQIKKDYNIYILRHSTDDEYLCQVLYNSFEDDPQVYNLNQNYNAVQLQNIISQFEFTIASRYHSVVHSYRSGVPAMIIGWANKYKELAHFFGQEQYQYDCRGTVDNAEVQSTLDTMSCSHEHEKTIIKEQFAQIQADKDILEKIIRLID